MEALLILFVVVRMLANAAEDVSNSVKGRPRRPRLTDRINNWKPTGQKGRYGARRYLGDLWQDAWTDARAAREAKRVKKLAEKAAAAQPDPVTPSPKPKPSPRPAPAPAPDPAAGRPDLRLVPPAGATPDPAAPPSPTPTPDPATPPAGDNQTPAPPAGKDDPMATTGEVTSVPAARSFAEAMLAHNKEVLAEIERARTSLESRGVSGPVVAELNSLREYYSQASARWEGLLKAIGDHERLAEAARNTQGAAKDMSFYPTASPPGGRPHLPGRAPPPPRIHLVLLVVNGRR